MSSDSTNHDREPGGEPEDAVPLPQEKRALIEKMGEEIEDGGLPIGVLNDPDFYELEKSRVFADTWVYLGHKSEIPEPGDYVRRYIAEDPFILARDEDGDLQVIFDACDHRGTKLCRSESGNTSHFKCPYHGWTYNNKGELSGIPFKEQAYPDVDAGDISLPKPRFDSYNGLIFATITDEAPPLEEYLGGMKWYLDLHFDLFEGGMEVIGEPHRYTIPITWKQGAENFAGDDYHILVTHQSAFEEELLHEGWWWGSDEAGGLAERAHSVFPDTPAEGHSATAGLVEDEFDLFLGYPEELWDLIDEESLTDEQYDIIRRSAVSVGTIFPNISYIHIAISNGPDQGGFLSLRQWKPKGPGEMEQWSWILGPKEAPEEQKELIYNLGMNSFSPAGNWEQDDMAVWDGITEAAGTTFAKKNQVSTHYEMGLSENSLAEFRDDWPSPGETLNTHLNEYYARQFHKRWYDEIAKKPL